LGGVQVQVKATGVLLRLATDEEVAALEHARRRGAELDLPGRSFSYAEPLREPAPNEVYIVAQSFAEFERGGAHEQWAGMEYHGQVIPVDRDATMELLELVKDARGDLVEIFADMRIARFDVSRWDFRAAPSAIVLDPSLDARLAPRRRG
jgi:hypothetical protein